jgi:hypothetical protein
LYILITKLNWIFPPEDHQTLQQRCLEVGRGRHQPTNPQKDSTTTPLLLLLHCCRLVGIGESRAGIEHHIGVRKQSSEDTGALWHWSGFWTAVGGWCRLQNNNNNNNNSCRPQLVRGSVAK